MEPKPEIRQEYDTLLGRLVLFAYDQTFEQGPVKPWENVQMLSHEGSVIWKINGLERSRFGWPKTAPKAGDTFVGLHFRNQKFYANTFSGHIFEICIETREASYHGFGK